MPERRRVPVKPARPKPSFSAADFKEAVQLAREPDSSECSCPRLDAAEWHEVESDWSDIAFVRTSMNAVMGVPVGFAGVKAELAMKALKAGAEVPEDAMLLLGEGKMRRPVMLEVEGAQPGSRDLERPGGVAYTRIVPAPMGGMKKAVRETRSLAAQKYGREPDALWIWYLTCRVCSGPREFETLILAHYKSRS